jgi:uncharacterized protein (DUF885 family)
MGGLRMDIESGFYRDAEKWLYRLLELDPVLATYMGDHRWDDKLADNSAAALRTQNLEMKETLSGFQALDTGGFSLDAGIDHTLVCQILKSVIRDHERKQGHRRDPGYYVDQVMGGLSMLIMKDFAPLPDRLSSVVGRLKETAGVLEAGKANIVREEVPRVWAEVAIEQAEQARPFVMTFLPSLAKGSAGSLESDLTSASSKAAEAMGGFKDFLEKDVLPNAKGDFAAGRDLFEELLRENHMVDYGADELLETGWRLFRETEEQVKAVAQEIDPARTVQEIMEDAKADHPTAEGLLPAYQAAMESARQYVVDHEIATIPGGETLRIIETPSYLRPLLPYAAYMPPGVLEEQQDGLFLVTPVDPGAPEEVQKEKLRGQNFAKLPVTALHEAYPGHHLQLVWANRQSSIPRRMGSYLSTFFIEGWAFYCEELMEQLGYIAGPVQRLGRLKDQLWRAARIILDVSLHTRGMPAEEAVAFLVEKCQLEPTNALAEVRRYTGSPTQPQSYLMGKLAILDLVEDYRRANPDLSLKEMHDNILGCGSLPPRLMRKRLLAD